MVNSARLAPLVDKIKAGPTEIDCRDDSQWWLKTRMGYLHPPGWKPTDKCVLCGEDDPFLPHLMWRCPRIDHQRVREGSLRSGGRRNLLLHRPLPDNNRAEEWWLSINRSSHERKKIGTYVHALHKERLRLIAGMAPNDPKPDGWPVLPDGGQWHRETDTGVQPVPDIELSDVMDAGLLVRG